MRLTMLRLSLLLTAALSGCATTGGAGPSRSAAASEQVAAAPSMATGREVGLYQRIVQATLDPSIGGSTTEVTTGTAVAPGSRFIAVSLAGGEAVAAQTPAPELEQELARFVNARPQLRKPGNYLGTWYDTAEQLIYFDVTVLVPYADDGNSRRAALAEANRIGVANKQKSVYDFGDGKTYKVATP